MNEPDAIIVLSAGIKRTPKGRWVSTDLTEEDDKLGAPGGKLRVLAAALLSNQYPEAIVIPSGGKGFDVPPDISADRPLLAEILRGELIEAGVPEKRLLLETRSNTTYQQLQEFEKLMAERGWNSLIVVSNRWHIPRLKAMFEAKFPGLTARVQLISAEGILIAADAARWEAPIARAYQSAFIIERTARENRGIKQMADGTYNFR